MKTKVACPKCGKIIKVIYPTRIRRFKCACKPGPKRFFMFADSLLDSIAKDELTKEVKHVSTI